MCGILGEFGEHVLSGQRVATLRGLVNCLRHRGPDDGAYWSDGRFFLGHRRLSIIDLSPLGRQPMASADGQLVVSFNGEIYNYVELREELTSLGHHFGTASDTEVLLHGYRQWGVELPSRLIGMFAFAIADRRSDELFMARDRFGEKPLLYSDRSGGVSFASELRPLVALPETSRDLDPAALASFLCLNYVAGDQTLLKGIRRLGPGSWRLYRRGGEVRSARFWEPPVSGDELPDVTVEAALERLTVLLDRAVAFALRSDVPVGIFLSGGIDSSLVASSVARAGRVSRAFCLTIPERSYSEWEVAETSARRLGIPISKVTLSPDALGDFVRIVEHADDPLADSSALAVWTLSREASKWNKVVLSGDGGDELFGGYLTYKATLWHRATIARLPSRMRELLAVLGQRLPTAETKVSRSYKVMRFLRASDLPSAEAHFSWNGTWLPNQASCFVTDPAVQREARLGLQELARRHNLGESPTLRQLQGADVSDYLPNDILVKADRMSMAHGLEVRAPFLEPTLAEFALRLPDRLKTSLRGPSKRLLREATQRSCGRRIARAGKQGFSIPIHTWLRGPAKELVQDLLGERSIKRLAFLDSAQVTRVVQDHMSGRRSFGFELWGLMVLVAWHRCRVEHVPRPSRPSDEVKHLDFPLPSRVA